VSLLGGGTINTVMASMGEMRWELKMGETGYYWASTAKIAVLAESTGRD
jgi:hypothetical protein